MSCEIPIPFTVRVAVRWDGEALALAVTVIELLLWPDEGVTVNHVAPFRVMLQLVFELIVKVFSSLSDEKLNEDGDTDMLGASCVTLMSLDIPFPLTVRVAIRGDSEELAVAVIVIV